MLQFLNCPICGSKLKTRNYYNTYLYVIQAEGSFVRKSCIAGMNHFLEFYFDKKTKEIVYLTLSIDPGFKQWADVDYYNNITKIVFVDLINSFSTKEKTINKIIDLDFPSLTSFKEKLKMYALFF